MLAGGLVGLALVTELRLARASGPPSSADRTAILIQVLVVGLPGLRRRGGARARRPADAGRGRRRRSAPNALAVIGQAGADALIAFLLAYRTAALRTSNLRDVAWFGLTGAAVVAIAAVALRSIEIPRILGPALLVLVFFLWDAIHSGGPVAPARPVARLGDRAAGGARDRRDRLERRHPRLTSRAAATRSCLTVAPEAPYLRRARAGAASTADDRRKDLTP